MRRCKGVLGTAFAVGLLVCAFLNVNAQEFKGTVSEFVKNDSPLSYMKFGMDGMKGNVTWVISPGTYVHGPIFDSKGNILRKGQLLATVDERFYKYDVESAEAALIIAQGILKDAENDYSRKTGLFDKQAIPSIDKDKAEAEFYKAKGGLKDALARVGYSKFILGQCELRAPFDGYVQEVFTRSGGWSNIDYPVLKLIRLNPLYVDVIMDRKLGREIANGQKTVAIISVVPSFAFVYGFTITSSPPHWPIAKSLKLPNIIAEHTPELDPFVNVLGTWFELPKLNPFNIEFASSKM